MTDSDSGLTPYERAFDDAETVGRVVRLLQLIDPEACVAGGWARDEFMGREAKDADCWLYTDAGHDHVISRLKGSLGQEFWVLCVLESGNNEQWAKWMIKATWRGVTFDIICTSSPVGENGKHVLERFDFGICKAVWVPDKGLWLHEDFMRDWQDRTLTYVDETRDEAQLPRAIFDHLPRLQKKFPGFEPRNIPTVEQPKEKRLTTFRAVTGWWGTGSSGW